MLELASDTPTPPPSRFYYRVGSDEYGWSDTRSFTAPQAAAPHVPLSVLITADMGETYEDGSQYHWEEPAAVNTTVQMAKLLATSGGPGVDLVLHPGDLSYATGYESERDRFMAQIEPYQGKEWGFSHMRVFTAPHLTLDFYADAPLDATAPIHHSVTLERAFPRV